MSAPLADAGSRFRQLEARLASRFSVGLVLIFCLALTLRLIYLNQMDQGIYFNILKMKGTDCFTFWLWALEIIEQDFLGRGVYHQSPLYSYFLAAVFKIFGANFYIPRFIQMALGSLLCVMVGLLGRRVGGATAGLCAALLCAVNGPLILYDGAILRSGLIAFINTLLVLLMFQVQDRPRFWPGMILGLVFGLAILAMENILILIPAFLVWMFLISRRAGWKSALACGSGLALGALLILALLVARNLKVGTPALEISSRGPLEFISGNVPDSPGVGWVIPASSDRILKAGGGKMAGVIREVLKENREHPWGLVRQQFFKAAAFLNTYEVPNNISLYVERRYVPFFRLPWPGFAVALALGLIGMALTARRRQELFPLYAYLGLYSLANVAFYILSRFRLPLVPVLIAFAGLGSAAILQALLEKKIRRGLILLLLAVGLVAINRPLEPDRLQFSDYQNMARFHSISNQPERGREIMEEGIARTRQIVARSDSADYRFRLALMLLLAGKNREEVRAELDQALRLDPPPSLKPSIEHLRRQL